LDEWSQFCLQNAHHPISQRLAKSIWLILLNEMTALAQISYLDVLERCFGPFSRRLTVNRTGLGVSLLVKS
jgi:hypothetical protein